MRSRPRRLLTIAHSYCVGLNRRLAHEIARLGASRWEVTAVAPLFVRGDLRPIALEQVEGELCALEGARAYLTGNVHSLFYGCRVRELLRGEWDLVHSWEEPFNPAGAQIAYWTRPSVPFVFWTAQNIAKKYPLPFSLFERYSLSRATAWLACGESIVQTLLPRGYDRLPHRILPLGVDVEAFAPNPLRRARMQTELGWSSGGAPVVGFVGRFVPEKGLHLLMTALDGLRAGWRAMFVGGGPMDAELAAWGARHPDNVRIIRNVPHDQVPACLAAMDILCAPSETTPFWREQQGRMLIEAFASGVPVIASDSGEIPYVVRDAGIIVAEKNVPAWIVALERLLGDDVERTTLSERGIERAHVTYAWSVIAQQHLAFFEEVLAR